MALGRISGQLLTSTLERDGIDLTITNRDQYAGYRLVGANQYQWFDYFYGTDIAPYICWVYGTSLSTTYAIKGYVMYI